MTKWLLIAGLVVLTIAILLGVVALIGARLPQAHAVSREVHLPASPEAVWHAITDVDGYTKWRTDVSRVERLPDRDGMMAWTEHGSSDRLTLAVARADPLRVLVVRIADPNLPFGGSWTYELTPASAGGTLLKVTENGEIYNPIFRFMARFVFGYEATMNAYLSALEKKFAAVERGTAAR